jgi:F0F1-type ATP synthase assembly protein I
MKERYKQMNDIKELIGAMKEAKDKNTLDYQLGTCVGVYEGLLAVICGSLIGFGIGYLIDRYK